MKLKGLPVLVIIVAMCALVASASAPPTPFMIYGYVFYEDGSACDNPTVNINNTNTSNNWSATTNESYNYYQLMLANGTDVNVSEILRFNVTSPNGNQSNITEHAVMQENITDGGIFNFNITLESPAAQNIIDISTCTSLNTAGATYILTADITNSGASKCMNITAEDITLDCQGHTIDGTDAGGSYGVYSNQYNTTVKNCVITNWEMGICYEGSNNGLIQNNTINSNSVWAAIYLASSSNTRITNNTANSNYDGFFLESSSNNTITENTITNNAGDGIYLCTSSNNNTITDNTVNSNGGKGIFLQSSSNNTVTNNTANSNSRGISLESWSSNNTIYSNKFENNTNYGIYIAVAGKNGANLIYNNLFNNTNNFYFDGAIYTNYWNTTKQSGVRIYADGTEIGGNYWTNATGTGYSDTCTDSDKDGFCDEQLNLTDDGKNIDYLPLSDEWAVPPAPTITDWYNNKTKNNFTVLTINESECVFFNATADQAIDVWNWFVNGTNQSHNFDNFSYCDWTVNGTYYVDVNGTNANGTSDTVNWTVTVEDITPPAKVQNLANSTPTATAVDLWWNANTETDLVGYKVYRNGSLLETTVNRYYNVTTGLASSTTYEFNVSAYDDNDLEGENATVIVTTTSAPVGIFDTRPGGYPSIRGTHTGTITPSHDVYVTKMYTYPCFKTDGHTEYVRFDGYGIDVNKTWIRTYLGAYQWIEFDTPFLLDAGVEYNYTIITGCYPQIHHTPALNTTDGWINCTKFEDANGMEYNDWIPAIRLE